VQNCDLPLNASMAQGLPAGGGGISLVTQSGAYGMAIYAVGRDERTSFAKVYAAGNKADIGDGELVRYLAADPATRTVCLFCESLPDGREFVDAAAALTPRKPVVVARTGRSVAGARAAESHTAALAGNERIWRAALERAGVVQARSGLEMLDVARALDTQPVPGGSRVAVVTNSGGTGVELADLLADEGVEVPELSRRLQDELAALLPAHGSPRNPVDMTTVWSRYAELYPLLVDRLARCGEVDVVVPVLLQRSATDKAAVRGLRDAVLALRADEVNVPVYVCWVTARQHHDHADLLQEAGIPCFDWPERTARVVGHAVRYGRSRTTTRPPLRAPARPAGAVGLPAGFLPPDTGARLLAEAGIAVVESVLCTSQDEAVAAGDRLGYPVVVKVVHPDLLHKSDVHGVRVGLSGAGEVRAAAAELFALAPGSKVLVQPRVDGLEVAVGGLRDPQLGPVVMVGIGGVLVEVLDDVVFGLAPLEQQEARRLLDRLRGQALLGGVRGGGPVDRDALAGVVRAAGDLLTSVPEVVEVDLNPVLVTAGGCLVVDWRVRVENSPGQDKARREDWPLHPEESRRDDP
jgi:acetyltransferase